MIDDLIIIALTGIETLSRLPTLNSLTLQLCVMPLILAKPEPWRLAR
jgi:hypothetical protein